MLLELAIKNFAIIDDLRIDFSQGLTILSGETGAGKSIIINAVNLLLGSRASARLIRTGENTAEIEAAFLISPQSPAAQALVANGFSLEEQLVIKRIISATNRHKIYLNGSLATMQALSQITANLASISGQHAHQQLLKEETHLSTLDQLAGLIPERERVRETYQQLLPLLTEYDRLREQARRQNDQAELLAFQKNEIESAAPAPDEDTRLEQEKKRLKNASELYGRIHACLDSFYDAPGAVIEQLADIRKNLAEVAEIDEAMVDQQSTLVDIEARVEDMVGGLRSYLETVERNDARLEEIEERLDLLNRLKKKYGPTLPEVADRLAAIGAELAGLENLATIIREQEEKITACHDRLAEMARALSDKRQEATTRLAPKIEAELAQLKMADTRFEITLDSTVADNDTSPYLTVDGQLLSENGLDRATFRIAPNPGEALKPLAGIASGGELSRVILALKALLADTESVETVVFDEVDAGIGGETAETVGKKLHALAGYHQIICISHLAQIAKFGDHHYKIEKTVAKGRTTTRITPLPPEDRVQEIARMSGGEKITAKTLAHAEEMLKQAAALRRLEPA